MIGANKMADSPTYERVLAELSALDSADQRRLLEVLMGLVDRASGGGPRHSIRELRGLGRDVWQGIDAQQYVDQERSTWDG